MESVYFIVLKLLDLSLNVYSANCIASSQRKQDSLHLSACNDQVFPCVCFYLFFYWDLLNITMLYILHCTFQPSFSILCHQTVLLR